jgi:hypothetical protein
MPAKISSPLSIRVIGFVASRVIEARVRSGSVSIDTNGIRNEGRCLSPAPLEQNRLRAHRLWPAT